MSPHQEYFHEGRRFPSVTEILGDAPKPWLEKWRAKWGILAERKTIAATNVGTKFHEMAEGLVWRRDVEFTDNRRVDGMAEEFVLWLLKSGFKPSATECHVVSKLYSYQGTFDAIGYLADKSKVLTLFDWKTSSGIYEDMALQLAAYAQAYHEQMGVKITRGTIVHVSKDKPHHKITVKEYKLTKALFNKFLKRLKAFNEARS